MKTGLANWKVPATFVIAIALFVGGWAAGKEASSFSENGPSWMNISKESRFFYVDGYDTAYRDGSVEDTSQWANRLVIAVVQKQITLQQSEQISAEKLSEGDSWTDKMSWTGWTAAKGLTDGEIEAGMDRFYANPANQGVCWREAFMIVAHSIAGQTFSATDMSAIRSASANAGCE